MKIITDNGLDIAPEKLEGLNIEIVPLSIQLGDKSYRGGVDIQSDAFYKLVRESAHFPMTSQPAPADFDEVYSRILLEDPDIISFHMSAQLSGTYNSARLGGEIATQKGANVTVIDSRVISGPLGWMVEAAGRAAKAGWNREQILDLANRVAEGSRVIFSPDTLKYLVNGGRVSHLQGLAASMLNIKPVLQVGYETGKIESVGKVRTMKKALGEQVNIIAREHGDGSKLRVQVEHADNPEMAEYAVDLMSQRFDCVFYPTTSITPLVGAHTGPGATAIVYAKESIFADVP